MGTRVKELKCPIKTCDYEPKTSSLQKAKDLIYGHLYLRHNKSEIIMGILVLAGIEDLEAHFPLEMEG